MNLTADVTTLAELRAFLEQCDRLAVPDDARVHARVGFGVSTAGPPLKALTVRGGQDRRQ